MIRINSFGILLSVVSVLVAGNAFANCAELSNDCDTQTQHQIVITGFQFVPSELQVAVGDSITWVNQDIVPHSIFVNESQKTLSPEFDKNEEFTLQVENAFDYSCGLHPSMLGEIKLSGEISGLEKKL